jgi:hypothetical protein
MNMGEEQQFNGLLDVYKKTFATNSIAGLYRDFFLVTCAGNIVCLCLQVAILKVTPLDLGMPLPSSN